MGVENLNITKASKILSDTRNDKSLRTIRNLWPQLTSKKNFDIPRNFDDYKKIASFTKHHLKIDGEEWYFNDQNQLKLREAVNLLYQISEIGNMVSYDCVWKKVKEGIKETITSREENQISFQKRLEKTLNNIFSEVQSYEFYWVVEGVNLIDVSEFTVGDTTFFLFNDEHYDCFKKEPDVNDFYCKAVVPFLDKNFSNKVVVRCSAIGEKDHAEVLARKKVEESINFIRFMFCYINAKYIFNNKWKLYYDVMTIQESGCFINRNIDDNTIALAYSSTRSSHNNFSISKENISIWEKCYFLDDLSAIMRSNNLTEWQDAILTAIHWIGEAQHEWDADVAFWKYWTAIESLIPPNKDKVTESVLKGAVVLIVYTGYGFINIMEFWSTHKRIAELYDKRSRITHSGLSNQIMPDELRDVCQYASWLILAAIGLHSQGYRKFKQVEEQIDRLFNIEKEVKSKKS